MLRKLIFIFCLIYTLGNNAYSQVFNGGVIAGLSTNQIDGDVQSGYKKLGFYSGVYVGVNFNEILGFKIELFYIGKGAKKTVNKIEEFKTSLNYIEMPFLLNIKALDKLKFNLGIAGAYLASSKLTKLGYEISKDFYEINNFDWLYIITSEFYITQKIVLNARFEYSLMSIRAENPAWINNNLSFGIVYVIK